MASGRPERKDDIKRSEDGVKLSKQSEQKTRITRKGKEKVKK